MLDHMRPGLCVIFIIRGRETLVGDRERMSRRRPGATECTASAERVEAIYAGYRRETKALFRCEDE